MGRPKKNVETKTEVDVNKQESTIENEVIANVPVDEPVVVNEPINETEVMPEEVQPVEDKAVEAEIEVLKEKKAKKEKVVEVVAEVAPVEKSHQTMKDVFESSYKNSANCAIYKFGQYVARKSAYITIEFFEEHFTVAGVVYNYKGVEIKEI